MVKPPKAASSRIAFDPDRVELDSPFAIEDFGRAFDANDVVDTEFVLKGPFNLC